MAVEGERRTRRSLLLVMRGMDSLFDLRRKRFRDWELARKEEE